MKNLALWTVSGGLFAAPQTRYMASCMLREDYDDFTVYFTAVRCGHPTSARGGVARASP